MPAFCKYKRHFVSLHIIFWFPDNTTDELQQKQYDNDNNNFKMPYDTTVLSINNKASLS